MGSFGPFCLRFGVKVRVSVEPGNFSIADDDSEVQTALLRNFKSKTALKIPSPRSLNFKTYSYFLPSREN